MIKSAVSPVAGRNPGVRLTRLNWDGNDPVKAGAVEIPLRDLVAYSQERGFTRLWLTGGHKIEVNEATEVIDRMVRSASAVQFPFAAPGA